MANSTCLGVIVGNRDFFPDVLISEARKDLTKLFSELRIEPVWLSPEESKLGAVETWADAQKVRRTVAQKSRPHRGHPGLPAEFWRRKGSRRLDPAGRDARAGSGAGLPRRSRSVRPRPAARRFLRQDFGLQQPAPVPHSSIRSRAITRSRFSIRASARIWCNLSRPARWCAA